MQEQADLVAYIDEAGERGFLRDLTPARDDEIGVFCALPIPAEHTSDARKLLEPLYQEFKAAAPIGAKLHITEAFKPGNEAWAEVARGVRTRLFELMIEINAIVIYVARRCSVARTSFENAQNLLNSAKSSRRSPVKIVGENRPPDEKLEDEIMTCLALMLDGFAEHAEMNQVDLLFDQIDKEIAERYGETLDTTRNISHTIDEVKGWNTETKEKVSGSCSISARAPFRLDSQYLGKITVVGKDDPFIFATDVVANSLWRHLKSLSATAPLNNGTSVAGWPLVNQVWGKNHEKNWDLI